MAVWEQLAMQAGSQAMSAGMGVLDEVIMGDYRRKKQLEQQQKLTDMQSAANKDLANHGMGISKEMWEFTNYENQRKHMEQAGLNPALMYGHAGAGGTTQATGAGSASGGQADDQTGHAIAATQRQGMAIQNAKMMSEIDVNKSIAEKNRADAGLAGAQTLTENEKREYFVENLRLSGHSQWLDVLAKDLKANGDLNEAGELVFTNDSLGAISVFKKTGQWNQEVTNAIANTLADTNNKVAQELLTKNKAKGYWQELINATKEADSDAVRAAAQKLASEWNTGELTNWKTWVDLGIEGVNTVANAVGVVKPKPKAAPQPLNSQTNINRGKNWTTIHNRRW